MNEPADILDHRAPLNLEASALRSWRLHCRLAQHLDEETLERWAPRILANLDQMEAQIRGEPHTANLRRWRRLVLEEDLAGLQRALTGLDEHSVQMREVSPLRGVLSADERRRALERDS